MKKVLNLEQPKEMDCDKGGSQEFVFTAQQTARALQVSVKSVYRLVDRGLLRKSSALRHLRITRKSIEEFLQNAEK